MEQKIFQNNWILNNDVSMTGFSDQFTKGHFFKPNLEIGKIFSRLNNQSLGVKYSKESSIARTLKTDSITSNSFSFETIQVYTNSDPTKENKWSFLTFLLLKVQTFHAHYDHKGERVRVREREESFQKRQKENVH